MKSKYSNPGAPSIVWFRLDLRLADNPALAAAVVRGGPVIPIFIWSLEDDRDWPPGRASQWWLHQSLAALDKELDGVGSKLIMRSGTTLTTLKRLIRETNAGAVFWNRRYEPAIIDRDTCIKQELQAAGLLAQSHNAALLHEPWTIQNKSGKPFQVFTQVAHAADSAHALRTTPTYRESWRPGEWYYPLKSSESRSAVL